MELLTPQQLSRFLQCKTSSIYAWARTGRIPCYKINGLLRFDLEEIKRWVEGKRVEVRSGVRFTRRSHSIDVERIVERAIESVMDGGYNSHSRGNRTDSSPERR